MKKILYIVLDGLSDLPLNELNNKTPLEAALTPNLDRLAQKGRTGLAHFVEIGLVPEPDIAMISLLGYDAREYYTGGGPLISFAEGLDIHHGDVSLRVNFATVEDDGRTIIDPRSGSGLTTEEAIALAKEINSKITLTNTAFEFKNTVGAGGVLVLRGMHNKLSSWINNTDPAYSRQGFFSVIQEKFANFVIESTPMAGYEDSLEAEEAASALNEFTIKANKVLNESAINKKRVCDGKPAVNIILSRDAGDRLPEFPLIGTVFNLEFGSLVEMPVERGIAQLTGMEIIDLPPSTAHLDVDYMIWAKIALEAINKFDAIYAQIKGPDEAAQGGNFIEKKEIIEAIDKFFFANLLLGLDLKNTVIAVILCATAASSLKARANDAMPFLISGGNVKPDGSLSFSEKAASKGALGELAACEILPLLVALAGDVH